MWVVFPSALIESETLANLLHLKPAVTLGSPQPFLSKELVEFEVAGEALAFDEFLWECYHVLSCFDASTSPCKES